MPPDDSIPALTPESSTFVLIEDDFLLIKLLARLIQNRFSPRSIESFVLGNAGLEHCLKTPPDILIVDLNLPDLEGREIIRRLCTANTATRVIVLTGNASSALPSELIALRVMGFVDKGLPLENIERAVERVLEGGMYFSSGIRPKGAPNLKSIESSASPHLLTAREKEIAQLVAGGMLSKEIGDRLGLSPRTVEKERAVIIKKIGTKDLPGLVRWCVLNGLA